MRIINKLVSIKNIFFKRTQFILRKEIKQKLLNLQRLLGKKKYGLNLIGYFSTVSGVAEVGRFFALHLMQSDIPFSIYNIDVPSHKRLDNLSLKRYQSYHSKQTPYYKNIYFINAD